MHDRCMTRFELTDRKPEKPGEIFVILDVCLGHANIIHYCSLPFLYDANNEMGRGRIANWTFGIIDTCRDCEIYLENTLKNYLLIITHIFEMHRNEDYIIRTQNLASRCGAVIYPSAAMVFLMADPFVMATH